MKITILKATFAFIIGLFIIQTSKAADSTAKIMLRPFGVGLHVEQYLITGNSTSGVITPTNTFILTANIKNVFRIEPEIGFTTSHNKTTNDNDASFKFGLGLYGMFQYGNLNMYVGARMETVKSHSQYTNTGSPPSTSYDTTTSFAVGPVLGGEYFVSKHFSFGGNLGLMFSSYKEHSSDSYYISSTTTEYSYVYTSTGLMVKFYF